LRRREQLIEEPSWPFGQGRWAQNAQPGRWPPDDITAVRAHIDAARDPARRAAQTVRVPKEHVNSVGTSFVHTGRGKLFVMRFTPVEGLLMLWIDIEHVEA
jgi:hypothetical protein